MKRFWKKVKVIPDSTSCWEWTANRIPKGYGRFMVGGKQQYAHRVSYEFTYGVFKKME